jgi:hypothetical protein
MRKASALTTIAAAIVLMGLMSSSAGATATAPTVEHFHFTSDPYPTNICGIDVIGVDTVSGMFLVSGSGATINAAEVTTVLTNPTSGKSITFMSAGVAKQSAVIDNGDGTSSTVTTVNGLSPKISELNGPPLDGIDTGSITFLVTFDTATGDFISFDVLSIKGPRPAVGCDLITAALT